MKRQFIQTIDGPMLRCSRCEKLKQGSDALGPFTDQDSLYFLEDFSKRPRCSREVPYHSWCKVCYNETTRAKVAKTKKAKEVEPA